jgi:hypothetical protein
MQLDDYRIGWNGKIDYPEFCNAYLEYATCNGKQLSDVELEKWEQDNPEQFYVLIDQSLL